MKYVTLLFILLLSTEAYACSCWSQGGFMKARKASSLVALVKVQKHLSFKDIYDEPTPMSMEVEIIQVLEGKEMRERVIIWGDNGMMCREYLSQFKEGEYYLMALHIGERSDYGHQGETELDFSISSCGQFWLDVNYVNRTVFGVFRKKVETRNLDKVLNKLK